MRKTIYGITVVLVILSAAGHTRAGSDTHLYIPRIAFNATIGECALVNGEYNIGAGVCHLEDTATIEEDWARIVLAGHTPGVFSDLVYVQTGDQIVIWNAESVEVYRVSVVMLTTVDDIQWLMPTETETLTLITCSNDLRLIIHAEREVN